MTVWCFHTVTASGSAPGAAIGHVCRMGHHALRSPVGETAPARRGQQSPPSLFITLEAGASQAVCGGLAGPTPRAFCVGCLPPEVPGGSLCLRPDASPGAACASESPLLPSGPRLYWPSRCSGNRVGQISRSTSSWG